MRLLLVALIIGLVTGSSAQGQPTLGFYTHPEGHSACVTIGGQTIQEVYVVYLDGPPMEAIAFTLTQPPCATWFWSYEAQFPTTIVSGDNVAVGFGECLQPPIHVLTLNLIWPTWQAGYDCCYWETQDLQAYDCNGETFYVLGGSYLSPEPCDLVEPHTPSPADGAVNVPMDVALSWESAPVHSNTCFVMAHNLYYGTDPNSLFSIFQASSPQQPISSLQPSTTYYWRAEMSTWHTAGPVSSPLWSFTTEGTVPIEQTTWGRIKSLYD